MTAKRLRPNLVNKRNKESTMGDEFGANEFTMEELDQLFNSEFEQETPPANDETNGQNSESKPEYNNVEETKNSDKGSTDTTKAFAKRLKESTDKARQEERDAIAKSLGYDSYDALQKANEKKMLEDKGLDPEQVSPVIDELLKKRLDEDPRMKELAELRQKQIVEFGKKELAEITTLTNGEITSLAQLPKEVVDLWKKKGSLKSAYLELEGEKLINKMRSEQSKGSTDHLNTPNGPSPEQSKTRPLTDEEKRVYKYFNTNISDEELNKKTYNK